MTLSIRLYTRKKSRSLNRGFSVLEVVLAAAVFVIVASGLIEITLQSLQNNRLAEEQTIASQFATEGIEAVRSIRNQSFASLTNFSGTGVNASSGVWKFAGVNNVLDKYTRVITVADAQRSSGNLVNSGGSGDPTLKKVVSTVTWVVTPGRSNSVAFTDYLANFRRNLGRGGILVYGNGGTTTDAMQYQTMDSSGTWSSAASMADVDGGSTNRAVRAMRVYASPTRNEKIAISRHYDGTVQYIYAQVYNGTSWGNVQLLSSWTAGTFLDVQNFDGAYINNGNFMAVYSDNTNTPKMRTWNGSTWSTQSSLTSLTAAADIPNFIVTRTRDATNEVMAAFFTQNQSTITEYWSGSAWSAITNHATIAPVVTKRLVDFEWSPNNTLMGLLVFGNANAANDRRLHANLWTANGTGGGSWGTAAQSAQQGNASTRIGAVAITPRPGATVFEVCNDNTQADILCYEVNTTPTFSNPTNQTIATTTPGGIQRDYDLAFESQSGNPAILTYSDNTTTPKLKKYTANTTTWDTAATSITTSGTPGIFQTFRNEPNPTTNDIMTVMADANLDLFSVVWNGTSNAIYTTPTGLAYLAHGTNGSAITDYWYDFAWDGN